MIINIILLIILVLFIYIFTNKINEYFTNNIIEFKNEQFLHPNDFKDEYKNILLNYSYYFNKKNLEKRKLKNINELLLVYISSLRIPSNHFIYNINKKLNYNINDKILPFLDIL